MNQLKRKLLQCHLYVQHLYVSLTELQVAREEEITRNPLSKVHNRSFDSVSFLYDMTYWNIFYYFLDFRYCSKDTKQLQLISFLLEVEIVRSGTQTLAEIGSNLNR